MVRSEKTTFPQIDIKERKQLAPHTASRQHDAKATGLTGMSSLIGIDTYTIQIHIANTDNQGTGWTQAQTTTRCNRSL